MKLGTKIILGFLGLIVLAMALGAIAIYMMSDVQAKSRILSNEYIPEIMQMTDVTRGTFTMRYQVLGIALSGQERYVKGAEATYNELQKKLTEFKTLVDKSPNLPAGKVASVQLIDGMKKYWESAEILGKSKATLMENLSAQGAAGKKLKASSEILWNKFSKDIENVTVANVATIKVYLKKLEIARKLIETGLQLRLDGAAAVRDDNMERMVTSLKDNGTIFTDKSKELRALLQGDNSSADTLTEMDGLFADYVALLNQNLEMIGKVKENTANTAGIGATIIDLTVKTSDTASKGTADKAKQTNDELSTASLVLIIGLLIAFGVGLVMALLITRGITGPINKIITNLNEAGEQVAAASGQISSASQSLAEGATEQAASLEESSSALEEMASMTRQNADNAVTANQNMSQTQQQVAVGAEAVRNMSKAMDEINDSSEKISRIIKTIEEIAFQTNLLALNAAVEAARAGDAGKGFAVVADEVRNLAQRSAQAARDTADLIESTVARVKNGTEIVQQLQKSFVDVETAANSVAGLINEISAASNEQAQGVDQVNTAVAQMDKVTQTNAANAEESASAAEELNAQAEQLRGLVNELVKIVRGAASASAADMQHMQQVHRSPAPRLRAPASMPQHKNMITSHASHPSSSGQNKRISSGASKGGPNVVKPNQVIPLDDDDDFTDF